MGQSYTNARGGITTYTSVDGLNRALAQVGKNASRELREASGRIAGRLVSEQQQRARGLGKLAAVVAPTIRVKRDRVPSVVMGSTAKLPARYGKARQKGSGKHRSSGPRREQTVGDVIFGAEFGGGARATTQQFLPHLGTTGRFFYPPVRESAERTMGAYSLALSDALRASK